MNDILIAITIGVVAGLIDVIPMIIMKLDRIANLSAFVHYFALGMIIPFVKWGIAPWLTGLLISILTAIPVMLIVGVKDKKSLIPMTVFAIILGVGIGLAGGAFVA